MSIARIVAASCFHAPFTDLESFNWLLDTIRAMKPKPTHFVHLGDWFEASAASVHHNEDSHEQYEEYLIAADQSTLLRKALGNKVKLFWTHGNHDDNILARDPRRIPKRLRHLVHWDSYAPVSKEFEKWSQTPYRKSKEGILELGPIIFSHGFDAGYNSDELECLQLANLAGGHSHRLVVRGHTHRPVPVTQAQRTKKIPLPWWYANVGTIGRLDPPWAHRHDTYSWGPALLYAECSLEPPPYSGRHWDAEVISPPR